MYINFLQLLQLRCYPSFICHMNDAMWCFLFLFISQQSEDSDNESVDSLDILR